MDFQLWDAPAFGAPHAHPVSSQWSGGELQRVTLNRGDLPDIAVSTMRPGLSAAPHQGLTLGALLEFAVRLTSAGPMTGREASMALVELSHTPGRPASLTVDGDVVDARRYEVPATGDWVVTSMASDLPVCVAGVGGPAVPALETADMTLWGAPLREQIAAAIGRR